MKGERIRYRQTGEFHFLTFSCYRRRAHLSAADARDLFEDALECVRLRYRFVIAGYVVMPGHVHLLVNEPAQALLSKAVQALKLSVSMRSRSRPFRQAHYYHSNVSTHQQFVHTLRYTNRNPVVRGLAASAAEWKWSSFPHYQTGARNGGDRIGVDCAGQSISRIGRERGRESQVDFSSRKIHFARPAVTLQ